MKLMEEEMDEKTKELIAVGASVSGHCQPCLTFHIGKARELGTSEDEIKEAVSVGRMVQKGAMSAMNKFAQGVLEGAAEADEKSPEKEKHARALSVYDPPMCCPTGICGTNVDSALVEFAGALKAAAGQGIAVERWNLAQQPQVFAENAQVKKLLTELGTEGLPFIFVDNELKWSGNYPASKELLSHLGIAVEKTPAQGEDAAQVLPFIKSDDKASTDDACCPGGGCC